ncbi:MAG: hypothetical protein ACKO3G_14255, partial [Planctomycetaceae bacterium]
MRSDPRSWSIFRALFPVARRWRRGPAVARRRRPVALRLGGEPLEGRAMLATYTWDGGLDGTGTNFLDPVNWAGDILPGPADTAIIGDTDSTATITLAGTASVGRIETDRNFLLSGGTLVGTTFTSIDGATFAITSGATLDAVTLNTDLGLSSQHVNIVNGLTLNGNLWLGYEARLY